MLTKGGVLANPFLLPLDRAERLGGIVAEFSKQQEDRDALRRETEILQAIFDNIPVMISLFDAAGRPVLVNREWQRVLGWSLEEARRTDILSETYPDPERRREVFEFMQNAEGRWKDFRTRTRDGRLIDTSWVRRALSDGTRIGFGLDLSERKRLERGIKTTEALLAEGEKLSHTGSWASNPATGKIFWSPEVFRIFGFEPGLETPSHPLFRELLRPADWSAAESTIPPEDRPAVQKSFNRAVAERSGYELDHRIIRPDGSVRDLHVVGHPVFGESGELLEYVGVLMDVTERRQAEDRAAALAGKAARAFRAPESRPRGGEHAHRAGGARRSRSGSDSPSNGRGLAGEQARAAPEALRLMQESGMDLPFLLVSGSVGEEVAVQTMRAGAHDFLLKGSLKRLLPAVERELEQAGQRRARRQAEERNRLLAAIVDSSDDAIISTELDREQ